MVAVRVVRVGFALEAFRPTSFNFILPIKISNGFRERQDGLFFRTVLFPEARFDPQFTLALDDNADVVAENFAVRLILHGHVRTAPDVISKLSFNHAEGAFDVAPLVVSGQKFFLTNAANFSKIPKEG